MFPRMRWFSAALLGLVVGTAGCSLNLGGECRGDTCGSASVGDDSTDTDTDTDGLGGWPGVACTPDPDETPRIYFDLQAGKTPEKDFFRLPFPADARLRDGGIDLEGFPRPPLEFAAAPELGAVVDRWLAHVEQDTPGFAINGSVIFRSSVGIGAIGGLTYVNVTAGHPNYGEPISGMSYERQNGAGGGNNYICTNWLAVTPIEGVILEPGVTYAVFLTDETKPSGGGAFRRDADLERMLQSAKPTDEPAASAWHTFAPLRAYLSGGASAAGVTGAEVIAATVFTTAPHSDALAGARAAVHRGPLHAYDFHECRDAGESPCSRANGLTDEERAARECGAPDPAFTEYHGRVTVPIFQEGVAPYVDIGGKIHVDEHGPALHAVEDVCFALTVPTGQAPDAGWPTLLFAHGTGGGFRGAIDQGLARPMGEAGIATLTIDAPLHGERRGDDDDDGLVGGLPLDQLVFNLRNPDSARDTPIQYAIDLLTATRLIRELPAATWPDEPPTTLDPANLFFMGHSQGGQAGVLFLAREPSVRAAVLAGAGGNLIQALLTKSKPTVDLGGASFPPHTLLQLAFQERPDRPLGPTHPVLNIFNTFVNRSDADAHSMLLRRAPLDGVPAKHLLLYIGHVDSYTPLRTAVSLAIGAGLEVADPLFTPPCDRYSGDERTVCGYVSAEFLREVELPASANVGGETGVALMLAASAGKDGHHVAFTATERQRIVEYFSSARDGAIPVVGE